MYVFVRVDFIFIHLLVGLNDDKSICAITVICLWHAAFLWVAKSSTSFNWLG